MSSALDLIKSAMLKAGILTKTESPTADEANDALETLNEMLDSWANDGLTVPYRTLENFNLVGGTDNYTIGAGGTFNTAKPISIISAYVRDGTTDHSLTIITDDVYAGISTKSSTGIPSFLNFTNAYPLATIRLYDVPSSAYVIYLLNEKTISNYTLTQTVDLPPGWKRAITYTLAAELAPEYGQQVPQEVALIAFDSMSKIKLAIAKTRSLDSFPIDPKNYNVFTGYR
jgi:hypothetical protein